MTRTINNAITIASGKGGVGKTWLTGAMAASFALQGKKVLVFDADFGLANLDIQLGLLPEKNLSHLVKNKHHMSELVQTCRLRDSLSFDIISGQSGTGSLANLSEDMLRLILSQLKTLASRYNTVLIDSAAGVSSQNLFFATVARRCHLIITDEPTSLTDAYAFFKTMHLTAPESQVDIIVNLAKTQLEGQKTYEGFKKVCEAFLKVSPTLVGIIQQDPLIKDAICHQRSIFERHPNAPSIKNVEGISKKLAEKY